MPMSQRMTNNKAQTNEGSDQSAHPRSKQKIR